MLVYDITQEKSFDNISKWLRNIEEHANEDVEKMILGNKCDMGDKRTVSKDRGVSVSVFRTTCFMRKYNIQLVKQNILSCCPYLHALVL